MNRLHLHVTNPRVGRSEVLLLIDRVDQLAVGGTDRGNDPADILDSRALLPLEPPRRIAF